MWKFLGLFRIEEGEFGEGGYGDKKKIEIVYYINFLYFLYLWCYKYWIEVEIMSWVEVIF